MNTTLKLFKVKYFIFLALLIAVIIISAPNVIYKNSGVSISTGSAGNGSLENGYQVDYKSNNAKYFSFVSYYILGTAYVNSSLYQTLKDSYKECETTCPGVKFRIMECSLRKGGKTLIHRSHRNGLSVDFMVPKKKNGKQIRIYDRIGLLHYLLNFDSVGRLKLNKKVSIDFDLMAKHIIALDNAARKNGLAIRKVILKIDLKDDFFQTKDGKEIQRRGIYFARNLTKTLNTLHDDHYHIDFKIKE
jgi:penicillin-insensitive murein DD-endopeptidase